MLVRNLSQRKFNKTGYLEISLNIHRNGKKRFSGVNLKRKLNIFMVGQNINDIDKQSMDMFLINLHYRKAY